MVSEPRRLSAVTVVVFICSLFPCAPAVAQEDVADVAHKDMRAAGDKQKRYFLIGPAADAKTPAGGFGLLVILPGGDGGAGALPSVKRIYKHAVPKGYLLAQLVAVKWTPQQQTVWPTEQVKVPKQKFSTEEFVDAVVKDVGKKFRLSDRIFALAWSSGGPAAYAVSIHKTKPVTGSFIAMSAFETKTLGPRARARGYAYFLYHSPEDKIFPYRMAKAAHKALTEKGAKVKLVNYPGGHGWKGSAYRHIREGIQWLESNRALYLRPGLGIGPVRFGMSHAEVIAYLGKPDKFEGSDDFGLNYRSSRGFGLTVHPRAGVQSITCWSKAGVLPSYRREVADFAGITPEGIGMGASRAQIIKAHGKPSTEKTAWRQADLSYRKLGIDFRLLNDRVVQMGVSKRR